MWFLHEEREIMDQQIKMEIPKVIPYIHVPLIFPKGAKNIQWEMIVSSTKDIDKMSFHRVDGRQKLWKGRNDEPLFTDMSFKLPKMSKC